jgi:probable HAF family extracellular repeat protein
MTDLGGFPGNDVTRALDINAQGQVVGHSDETPTGWHALLWEGGVMTELSALGGGFAVSQALAINERGQIVGSSQTSSGHYHATLWTR